MPHFCAIRSIPCSWPGATNHLHAHLYDSTASPHPHSPLCCLACNKLSVTFLAPRNCKQLAVTDRDKRLLCSMRGRHALKYIM